VKLVNLIVLFILSHDIAIILVFSIIILSYMVSDSSYINLYMVEYNVIYLCELTHHTLT
jgi:hypothetical protein